MIRWSLTLTLLAGVLGSAVALVMLKHEARQLFVVSQAIQRERDEAQVEWSRLQLEQAWLGEAGRIEEKAVEELNMERPEKVRVIISDE